MILIPGSVPLAAWFGHHRTPGLLGGVVEYVPLLQVASTAAWLGKNSISTPGGA